jgi:genome maintenance exonuclease 1
MNTIEDDTKRKFNFVKLPELDFELNAVTTEDGRRYTAPNGEVYPSITTVLSSYNKKAIYEWRKRVGEEEANRVSRKAANRGTKLHSLCEDYLKNELTPMKMQSIMPDTKELFLQLRPELDANIGDVYGLEQALYSKNLQIAGRCDCIAEWNGELSIIDYKTSSKEKNEDHIQNYFMQCTAYAEMFEEITGRPINQIVVAIAVEGDNPQFFVRDKHLYVSQLKQYISNYRLTN